jgi:hypothetical protein
MNDRPGTCEEASKEAREKQREASRVAGHCHMTGHAMRLSDDDLVISQSEGKNSGSLSRWHAACPLTGGSASPMDRFQAVFG